MSSNIPFSPVRGVQETIDTLPISDGKIYYAYDTGKIYLDKEDKRYPMSGGSANGASFYYGNYDKEIEEDPITSYYYYPIISVEVNEESKPRINDIILDSAGFLYRIQKIQENNYACSLLPLSGSGGGTAQVSRPSIQIMSQTAGIIVNGQPAAVTIFAKSALDENEIPYAQKIKIYWSLVDNRTKQVYYTGVPFEVDHEGTYELSLGEYLKDSTATTVNFHAEALNHEAESVTRSATFTTVEMYLETYNYSASNKYDIGNVVLQCYAVGNLSKILEWRFDDILIDTVLLSSSAERVQNCTVPTQYTTHGYHTVEINLFQNEGNNTNPIKGISAETLRYEIIVKDPTGVNTTPIISLGDYKDTYYNYDTIQIPFYVYNPTNTASAEVYLYKDDVEIEGSPRTITNFSDFSYWQIADAELNKENYYSIACGTSEKNRAYREIKFKVIPDADRDMTIKSDSTLKLNFDPVGRSNSEAATKRASWSYGEGDSKTDAVFENFNWYNNGWYIDSETKNTFLRISNGAKFTIPFDSLVFGTTNTSQQSNSIEIAFKMRNIQNYKNLITNITRYNGDDTWYTNFMNQTQYSNYDAYLQATLTPTEYEDLKFSKVQKNIDLNNVACGFYSGNNDAVTGICIGPQDAFFSNGVETVNVPFVENEMVYLSFVYNHELRLLFIYINGVITGVIKSSVDESTGFKINSTKIEFLSNQCDIDLYKLRIYSTGLDVNDVLHNYAVDQKDVNIYDQNLLALKNLVLGEYQLNFNAIDTYISNHPDKPLMPYIIFDTTESGTNDKLPYAKANGTTNIKVEFVNTPLDTAYKRGELTQKAIEDGLLSRDETNQDRIDEAKRLYYKHNCPSWTSTMSADDIVTIEVQGTSSEFYPRRNFKIKTKYKKANRWDEELTDEEGNVTPGYSEEECLNIFMHKGPYEKIFDQDKIKLSEDPHYYGYEASRLADGWYMNNYTNPTDRWTMKVDYMESSGSYNAGFASLMGTAYTKHPLKDYIDAGVLTNTEELKSPVFNATRWQDYRTSLLGFPVMAFQKRKKIGGASDEIEYLFIGYYRMLLDKGSDQVLGFKTHGDIKHKILDKKVKDIAECWEFATNARTFCSYRDAWNRVELSFKAPKSEGLNGFIKLDSGNTGGPVVLNHFEPRYFKYEDYLKNDEDGFYNFGNLTQDKVNEICDDLGIERIAIDDSEAMYKAQDAAVDLLKNWEKVCKWVYSTNLDNVKSQGDYKVAPVGEKAYQTDTFYIMDKDDNGEIIYNKAMDDFDSSIVYYEKSQDEAGNIIYTSIQLALPDYVYVPNKFYIKVADAYSLCTDATFDSSATYYEFESLSDSKIAEIADPLIIKADTYNASTVYYTYDSDAKVISGGGVTGAIAKAGNEANGLLTEEEFNAGVYYIPHSVSYDNGKTVYKYDTKEYRTAKFVNELSAHFDLEYLATYFIMTEVFECYDSRGKNCMMASWGPLVEGGEYIWYPIFYDIDTQLGINNTGIPSFEFNVDATEAGNYSTSDSILWNNFYKFFKGSAILNKYKNLRKIKQSTYSELTSAPLEDVNNLEKWYKADPEITKNIANKGIRPLMATNLDMYFKYITITNKKAKDAGVAYIAGADGEYAIDTNGTYYYALQGDRSQSRRQFLTNRIEYIDSWLNQKNYARGGNNRIRGRISANKPDVISDKWVETDLDPYWKNNEFGEKTHDFDAEYWLTLKPIRSSYVTAGDDSANYPSQKYDGISDGINFKLYDIENGIRRSQNYPEQLVYIYGMNQMADYINMHKLYWTEFYMEGNADHLVRLCLGYDGESKTDKDVIWYNRELNGINLTNNMPLLKEANFSNITVTGDAIVLNLSNSEKLENFRATGTSGVSGVTFADGVALNTAYLPSSVTSLKLIQANLLTTLLDQKAVPRPIYEDGKEVAPPKGLFLEGFFGDNYNSSLTSIHLNGGSLGHASYKILKRFYDVITEKDTNNQQYKITMIDVNWSPYVQLTEGAKYNNDITYYINDKHYGFEEWNKDSSKFENLVLNGQLYVYNNDPIVDIGNDFKPLILDLYNRELLFSDAASSNKHPVISGIVYVNNTNDDNGLVEESYIRNELQPKYPNLTFFFENVTKAYSAEFLYRNPVTGADEYVKFADGITTTPSIQKISKQSYESGAKTWFDNPFDLYLPKRTHYVFKGWSTNPNARPDSDEVISSKEEWNALTITPDQYDYIYYAIFEIDKYDVIFYDGDGEVLATKSYDYGTVGIETPNDLVPYKDDSSLGLLETYGFKGYTDNLLTNNLITMDEFVVRGTSKLYPVFEPISVYKNIHPEYFSAAGLTTSVLNKDHYGVKLQLIKNIRGKITIPKDFKYNGIEYPVYMIDDSFASMTETGQEKNGKDLTHVFFAEETQIQTFATNAFRGGSRGTSTSNLKFVEFPNSLRVIESNAFLLCKQLDYTEAISMTGEYPRISGANITTINSNAFQQAFAKKYIQTLNIGPSVVSIFKDAFFNTQLIYSELKIGSEQVFSNLNFINNSNDRVFNILNDEQTYNVTFYSNIYGSEDEPLFTETYQWFEDLSTITII